MSGSKPTTLTPSQIRAGRALLGWSQDQLANAAKVGLSTVRDYEKERRGGEIGGLKAIRLALENEGVVFLASEGNLGPGARLLAKVPNVLRRPRKLGRFDGMMFTVEWRGREFEVYVAEEEIDDLGRFPGEATEEQYIGVFEKRRMDILQAAAKAIDAGRVTPDRRVYLEPEDFPPGAL